MTGKHVLNVVAATVVAMILAPVAQAHTFGAHGAGFAAGLAHPFIGVDHLLAMVAVGLWAAQLGGRALWIVPGAFVVTLTIGSALAFAGIALPGAEIAITGSLLVLGVLVTLAVRLPVAIGGAMVAAFALFHGHAHGAELPQAASPGLYATGFILATVALHALGVAAGTLWRDRYGWLTRAAGLSVLGGGLWLLAG